MPERFLAALSTLPLRSRKNTAEAMAVGSCGLAAVEDIDLSLSACEIYAHGLGRSLSRKQVLQQERQYR